MYITTGWGIFDEGTRYNRMSLLGYTRQYLVASSKSHFLDSGEEHDETTESIVNAFSKRIIKDGPNRDPKTLTLDAYNINCVIVGVLQPNNKYKILGKDLIKANLAIETWKDSDNNAGKMIMKGIKNNVTLNCWLKKDGTQGKKYGGMGANSKPVLPTKNRPKKTPKIVKSAKKSSPKARTKKNKLEKTQQVKKPRKSAISKKVKEDSDEEEADEEADEDEDDEEEYEDEEEGSDNESDRENRNYPIEKRMKVTENVLGDNRKKRYK